MTVPSRGTQLQTRRGPYPTRYVLSLSSGIFTNLRFNLPWLMPPITSPVINQPFEYTSLQQWFSPHEFILTCISVNDTSHLHNFNFWLYPVPVFSNPHIELAGLCPQCYKAVTSPFLFYSDWYLAKFVEFQCVFVKSWNKTIILLNSFRDCSFSEGRVALVNLKKTLLPCFSETSICFHGYY